MPFTIRPCCPVTYQTGLFEGRGTVWNLSLTGWRFSIKFAAACRRSLLDRRGPARSSIIYVEVASALGAGV